MIAAMPHRVQFTHERKPLRRFGSPKRETLMRRLASVDELHSKSFASFMAWINGFARVHGLRTHTNWSKIWEYPWSWQYLRDLNFPRLTVLDIGSEISPMPWFFASLGARVWMIESDDSHLPKWHELKAKHDLPVHWYIVSGPSIPLPDDAFDLVTSYSVLEHIPDKETALAETVRILKPGGLLCLTFDICEPSLGMSYPEWNGSALDMETFDRLVWRHEALQPLDPRARWNIEDMDPFLQWHRQTAPHHDYVVGGTLLRKKGRKNSGPSSPRERLSLRAHQLDTGLGSGNTGDDAMFLAAHAHLPSEFALSTEVHAVERAEVLPRGVRYLSVRDADAVEESIRSADLALLIGDTPVMDQWGLDWPLRANAAKLLLCHRLQKAVHAIGVGVDRLTDPEGLQIFRECYAPIASWSVRSRDCKDALVEMGIAEQKITIGADWAWLLRPRIDALWANEWLRNCGAKPGKVNIGVNLVNEIWRDRRDLKDEWAALLDRIAERFGAQIFFFCNESRSGEYYDRAAAEDVRARMKSPSLLVANRYYRPDEMISLLSLMTAAFSQRYHFTLFSLLADVCPVSIARGQKMRGLHEDLGLPCLGDMERFDKAGIEKEVEGILEDADSRMRPLRLRLKRLESRAQDNLMLLRKWLSDQGGTGARSRCGRPSR